MDPQPSGLDISTMPTLQELNAFLALSKAQTITDVAATLHLSQSQLSRILRQLEDRLGAKLFQRSTSGLRITVAGETFLHTCTSLQRTYAKEMRAFQNQLSGEAGEVRVTVLPSMAFAFLGAWTNDFRAAHPQATLTATDDISGHGLTNVVSGNADVAISACILRLPNGREHPLFSETATMDVSPILSERFFLVSPSGTKRPSQPD